MTNGPGAGRPGSTESLADVVAAVLAHPGLRAKAEIGLVGEVLGGSDWISGPGDDGAPIG